MVIRNMVQQFNLPIRIVGGETARAADGLALSSRNGYLSPQERMEAPRLARTLQKLTTCIRAGDRAFARLEKDALAELKSHGWQPDYVAVRRQADLQSPALANHDLVVLAAAKLGSTRLIDNLEISTSAQGAEESETA